MPINLIEQHIPYMSHVNGADDVSTIVVPIPSDRVGLVVGKVEKGSGCIITLTCSRAALLCAIFKTCRRHRSMFPRHRMAPRSARCK